MSQNSKSSNISNYSAEEVEKHFDEFGVREWNRLIETPLDEVSLYIHTHYLEKYVPTASKVLEIGAGAGRFTQVLANLGTRILVADISTTQLNLNKQHAHQYSFRHAIEGWRQVDICDMSCFQAETFGCVVAYGGPLSYVLDKRDTALRECIRVLQYDGILFLSVMSLWGSACRHLEGVLGVPVEVNRRIIDTGDISPKTWPERKGNYMHLFRAKELRRWLSESELAILSLSASNCLSIGLGEKLKQIRNDTEKWSELLQMELSACAEEGCLDMGPHMIAVVKKV